MPGGHERVPLGGEHHSVTSSSYFKDDFEVGRVCNGASVRRDELTIKRGTAPKRIHKTMRYRADYLDEGCPEEKQVTDL